MVSDGLRAVCGLTVVALLFLAAGCQLTPSPGLIACPMPVNEQAAKVLQVAPLGTPRDEVLRRLKDAGIRGNFGENESIYYCDLWDRDKKVLWHINVVLLFDDNGKLYKTRPNPDGPDELATHHQTSGSDVSDPFQ